MKKDATQLGIVTELPQGSMNQDNFFNFYVGEGLGKKPEPSDNSIAGKQTFNDVNHILPNNGGVQDPTHNDRIDKAFNMIPKEDSKTVIPTDLNKEELKQQEYQDYKGGQECAPTPWNNAQIVPQQSSTALPPTMQGPTTSPVNVPGMAQSDCGICNTFNLTPATNFTTNKKQPARMEANGASEGVVGNVHGDVHGKVTQKGMGSTRGTHATINNFNLNKEAASPFNGYVDITTPSATHNNQSPWRNDGKNTTSYTNEEKELLKQYIVYQKPANTAIPYTFEERLFKTDEDNMAGGGEVITKDFAISPTNELIDTDKSKLEGDKQLRDGFNMFFHANENTDIKK